MGSLTRKVHNDESHTGSAKRDTALGVAGLDSVGNILGVGTALKLTRSAGNNISIDERTSSEGILLLTRVAANDYDAFIFEAGAWKQIQTVSMKDIASGIASLDAGGGVLAPGREISLTRDGTNDILIVERTSGETPFYIHRVGITDYQVFTKEGGAFYRMQTASMKDAASGIAGLNASAKVPDANLESPVGTHAALTASAHTLQSDGSELISTANKSQFKGRGAAGIGGSVFYESGGSAYYGTNCEYDGTNWNRVDITKQAWVLQISSTGVQYIYGTSAGANPISTWDLGNQIPVLKSHRDENVSATVHPNAERTANKNAASGYAGLDASAKVPDANLESPVGTHAALTASHGVTLIAGVRAWLSGSDVYHGHDASANTTSQTYVKLKTITLNHLPNSTLRIYFEGYGNGNQYARVYRNGVAVGTEKLLTGAPSWDSLTENISGWSEGNTLELWAHGANTYDVTVRNFRILNNTNVALTNS